MSRLSTYARFEEPEDEVIGAYCGYCDEELYRGEEVVLHEMVVYCNYECCNKMLNIIETLL